MGWIDEQRLLPNAASQGFLFGQARAQQRPAYLDGSMRDGGWWYYVPAALLMKTQLVLLVLAAAGATSAAASASGSSRRHAMRSSA